MCCRISRVHVVIMASLKSSRHLQCKCCWQLGAKADLQIAICTRDVIDYDYFQHL